MCVYTYIYIYIYTERESDFLLYNSASNSTSIHTIRSFLALCRDGSRGGWAAPTGSVAHEPGALWLQAGHPILTAGA